jgi:cytochrome P450
MVGSGTVNISTVTDIDPQPFYDAVREQAALVWDEGMNGWLVASYDLCRHIQLNEQDYRNVYTDASDDTIAIKGGKTVLILQGEEHARMHRFMLNLFAPKLMGNYRELYIKPIINQLIDNFIERGSADLWSEFCDVLAPRIIMSLLGLPWDDENVVRRVISLNNDVLAWIGAKNQGERTEHARKASQELNEMLLPYIRERRDHPTEDLISRVWIEGKEKLGGIDEADALAICREMFLGGADTTAHAIVNGFYLLLTRPETMSQVVADPEAATPAFAEETLRLFGSVHYRFRIANMDGELGGIPYKKDHVFVLINAAANRDPARYEGRNEINLKRPGLTEHLGFNKGPRTCVGAALARAELIEATKILLSRTRNLRLDPSAPTPTFKGIYIRSFQPLKVLFDAA